MPKLVPPHGGGPLKPLLVGDAERVEVAARAESLARVSLSRRELSDLCMRLYPTRRVHERGRLARRLR